MTDMKFTTWEDAARWAATDILALRYSSQCWGADRAARAVDEVAAHFASLDWPRVADFGMAGLMLAQGMVEGSDPPEGMVDYILSLLARKQHDYGHDNIMRHGIEGVKVRVWDKIARLQNLVAKGDEVRNESVVDTWTDIVGYSIIAVMLENGIFELPLSADVVAPAAEPTATVPRCDGWVIVGRKLFNPSVVAEIVLHDNAVAYGIQES